MEPERVRELAQALARAMNLLSIVDRQHQTPDVYIAVRAARHDLQTATNLIPEDVRHTVTRPAPAVVQPPWYQRTGPPTLPLE